MDARSIRTPALIFRDHLVRTRIAPNFEFRHRVGGPLEMELEGWPKQMPEPHRLLTLGLFDPILLKLGLKFKFHKSHLPLVYSFRISGCRMKYELESPKLLSLKGEPGKNWPYKDYPPIFPTVPLVFEK